MAQAKPTRLGGVVEALKAHGLKDEDVASIQTTIDPLLLDDGDIHVHVEGDDTHIHVDHVDLVQFKQ